MAATKTAEKAQAPEKLKDNPAEFTTCSDCGTRRRLPEECKCDPRHSTWK